MKAFGVFIRLPKPRAPLPIRLVDTASHVNEMQSGREKGRETPTSLCQFFAGARSLFLRRWLSLLLSVCRPRDVTPFHPPHTAPPSPQTHRYRRPATSDSSALTLQDNELPFLSFFLLPLLCKS